MAGWGWSLESLKSKVQEASEKVALGAMPCVCETPARCACAPTDLVFVYSGRRTASRLRSLTTGWYRALNRAVAGQGKG